MASLDLATLLVHDYDTAIAFFVDVLGFELAEDSAVASQDGRPKRWVVVRPSPGAAGLLLAEAADDEQRAAIGRQCAARVGFFLHVEDFEATYDRLVAAGVTIEAAPRKEPFGTVVVFRDVAGNRWDLLGPL